MGLPSVSVFIPVRNEAAKIGPCLEGILTQTVEVREVIVVDSGSTDETVAIARSFDRVKVVEIPPAEFNHGGTRALGPAHATGEAILYTVGDARPADDKWIAKMLAPMAEDQEIAAVCGAQVVPHESDKNPIEWFRPQSEPQVSIYQFSDFAEFLRLPQGNRRSICGWDDVSALYRREALQRVPFMPITYGEDMDWICRAIGAGVKFAYNPAARVYHYHQIDRDFAKKQTFATVYHRYRLFGLRSDIPKLPAIAARTALQLIREKNLTWAARGRWLAYNLRVAQGVRDALIMFERALSLSEAELDEAYKNVCGKPPVPRKH